MVLALLEFNGPCLGASVVGIVMMHIDVPLC